MVCLWCYVVVKIKMVCDVVVIGKNGMDDFQNIIMDVLGDDCLWYSDINVCLNDEGVV